MCRWLLIVFHTMHYYLRLLWYGFPPTFIARRSDRSDVKTMLVVRIKDPIDKKYYCQ